MPRLGPKQSISVSSASGIFTLKQAQEESGSSNWPSMAVEVEYLVIAGGGGGSGGSAGGGGGGAGGYRTGTGLMLSLGQVAALN